MNGYELINPFMYFLGIKGHVALDRNLGLGYDTLLLQLIPGDLQSACIQTQFHTLLGLLHSVAAASNSYPKACVLYHFYDVLWHETLLRLEPTAYRMRGRHTNH